jgi:hypothetical protein
MMRTLWVYDSTLVGGGIVKWRCTIRVFKYSRCDSPVLALQRNVLYGGGWMAFIRGRRTTIIVAKGPTYSRIHGAGTATMSTAGRH